MKYTQFLELSELLKDKKLEDILNEADEPGSDDKLETTKPGFKESVTTPKKALMRKSMNKHAEKLQAGINKDIETKFITPLVDQKVKLYQKMAEVGKGKQPKDIVAALKGDLLNMKKIEEKQTALIEKTAQSILDNYAKKITTALEKKGFKEKSMADLQSYWTLLSAQIMNNLFKKLVKLDDQAIEKTIQDKGILNAARIINKALSKGIGVQLAERDKKIRNLQSELKSKIAAEEKPAEKSVEQTK
jgi:hypothetical protein